MIILKSASILRMMEDFLGLQVFKEGLTDYLNYGRYYTATTDNLWKFLDIAATKYSVDLNGLTVKDIMDTWFLYRSRFLYRSTFPVVKVHRNPENYSEITVKQ
ncbi:aminopeptidase N-like, partial [Artemia franciscana]|uniref:aminopeptidase N-like n=1 Tax=Artemia franciscana TaxID=6661 RepID=UPI0032DB693C